MSPLTRSFCPRHFVAYPRYWCHKYGLQWTFPWRLLRKSSKFRFGKKLEIFRGGESGRKRGEKEEREQEAVGLSDGEFCVLVLAGLWNGHVCQVAVHVLMVSQCIYWCLWQNTACPFSMIFIRLLCLFMWPKYLKCLISISVISYIFRQTSVVNGLCFHEITPILLYIYISRASIWHPSCLLNCPGYCVIFIVLSPLLSLEYHMVRSQSLP